MRCWPGPLQRSCSLMPSLFSWQQICTRDMGVTQASTHCLCMHAQACMRPAGSTEGAAEATTVAAGTAAGFAAQQSFGSGSHGPREQQQKPSMRGTSETSLDDLLAYVRRAGDSTSDAEAWAAAHQAFQLAVPDVGPELHGRAAWAPPSAAQGRTGRLVPTPPAWSVPGIAGAALPDFHGSSEFSARVCSALDATVARCLHDTEGGGDNAAAPAAAALAVLAALPQLLRVYAGLGHTPAPAVQRAAAAALASAAAAADGAAATPPLPPGEHQAPLQQQPQRHTSLWQPQQLLQQPPAQLDAVLAPEYVVRSASAATAARAHCGELWTALGRLAAAHIEVLPPDALASLLHASASSGACHDTALFGCAARYLAPPWYLAGGIGGSASSSSGGSGGGGSVTPLQAMQPGSLAAALHAMALVHHADQRLRDALMDEVSARLSPRQASLERPSISFGGLLSGSPVIPLTTAPVVPGRGFTIQDLSRVAYACAVLGCKSPELVASVSREAFAQLLQIIERQEQQQQQPPKRQRASCSPARQLHRQQAALATQAWPAVGPIPPEGLAALVWGLNQAGSCQPVMLDAVSLLLEPSLGELAPAHVLWLLEACHAVASKAGGARNDGGVGGAPAPDASKELEGVGQLLAGLAPVIANNLHAYSVRQAAQVAVHYAAVQHYDEDLLRGLCARVQAACPTTPRSDGHGGHAIAWGPVIELIVAAAQLRFCASGLLDAVNAAAEASLSTASDNATQGSSGGELDGARGTGPGEARGARGAAAVPAWPGRQRLPPGRDDAGSDGEAPPPPPLRQPLLPAAPLLARLAHTSAALGRGGGADRALLSAAARAAASDLKALSLQQLSELTWALALSGTHTWPATASPAGQQGVAAGAGAVGATGRSSGGGKGGLGHARHLPQARVGGDGPGPAPGVADGLASLALETYWRAAEETNDVLSSHVLLLCQAHLLLLSTLPDPHEQLLRHLPSDWLNTMLYAWEQEYRRARQERRRAVHPWRRRPPTSRPLPTQGSGSSSGSSSSSSGNSSSSSSGSFDQPDADLHDPGAGSEDDSEVELQLVDLLSVHKELGAALGALCASGGGSAGSVLVERVVKVGGFLVHIDVTLEFGGHAVAVLLDGPHAHVLADQQQQQQQQQPHTQQEQAQSKGSAVGRRGEHKVQQQQGAALPAGFPVRVLGPVLWRERVLQRLGWIVARVHWHEWREACTADGDAGKAELLRAVLAGAGVTVPHARRRP